MPSELEYRCRLSDDVDLVLNGRQGAVSEDRWLVNYYQGEYVQFVSAYLDHGDSRVRAETVMLLTYVRDGECVKKIREMRISDSENVRLACLSYLDRMESDDRAVTELMETLRYSDGKEFTFACKRLSTIARKGDVDAIRKIYGQVDGVQRQNVREVLEAVIDRNPDLKPKRDLLLSVPVYPDEDSFERFLDRSVEYIDVRYRNSMFPKDTVSATAYNNVAKALRTMRHRLYNEADNLEFYGPDKTDRYMELNELMKWAGADLKKKAVVGEDRSREKACPRCGNRMVLFNGSWSCPDCGRE
ncbi:MAG: HEAT repeat domain-containing protein [Candidatus Methanomethylophilaceae archaeon]|nr:HEAT repeat domain-containing protein [Candidatus Methanomethylophilaceae archaeon]